MNQERIELHTHTRASAMDAVTSVWEMVIRAAKWGHPAVAVTDHGSVQAFPEAARAAEYCRERGMPIQVIYGMEAYLAGSGPEPAHFTILAKNKIGLKNLYKLVSISHLRRSGTLPLITEEELSAHRDGLLLGSGCQRGALFQAAAREAPWEELSKIAKAYDYLEILPAEEAHQAVNRRIFKLGEALHIPVCAVGDVHYLNPDEKECHSILLEAQGLPAKSTALYFRSTEDMLREFSYLGEEAAFQSVVENPRKIANQIQQIYPVPKGRFYPHIEGVEERLTKLVVQAAQGKYGNPLPKAVEERLQTELDLITENDYATLFWVAHWLAKRLKEQGGGSFPRGTMSASFVAYLADISNVNPLPPHYHCPHCGHFRVIGLHEASSGYDLPEKACPRCGHSMIGDGQNIPFETAFGCRGETVPQIDFSVHQDNVEDVQAYLQELFPPEQVIKGGVSWTVGFAPARDMVHRYSGTSSLDEVRQATLTSKILRVTAYTKACPNWCTLLPSGYEPEDFTPLQLSDNDRSSTITHLAAPDLSEALSRVVADRHPGIAMCRRMEQATGLPAASADLTDPEIYRAFSLGDTQGLTVVGCDPAAESWSVCKPKCFSDLVKVMGLICSDGAWTNNAEKLLANRICSLTQVIGDQDDVFNTLVEHGIDREEAYRITKCVRLGRANRELTKAQEQMMLDHGIPEWYLESCKKISYVCSRAHTAQFALLAARLCWFKVHFPAEFEAARHAENL